MSIFSFSTYSLVPALVALFFLFVGFLVLYRNPKKTVNITFFLLTFATFAWQGIWAILFQVKDYASAVDIAKLGYFFIIFLPTFMYHFLSKISQKDGEKKWIILSYIIDIGFVGGLFFLDKLFVSGVYKYFWGFYPKAGILHPAHVLQTSVIVSRGLWIVFKKSTDSGISPEKRNQLAYCVVGLLVYFAAAIDYLCNYGVEFYPPGVVFVAISLSILAYAITKHDLLDIKFLIARKDSKIITGIIAGLSFILIGFLPDLFTATLAAMGLGIFWYISGPAIQLKIQTPLEERFLKGHYEVDRIVRSISERLFIANSRQEVIEAVTEEFKANIQIKYVWSVLAVEGGEEEYECQRLKLREMDIILEAVRLGKESEVIRFFSDHADIYSGDQLSDSLKKELPIEFYPNTICIPLHSNKALQGIFILGPKLSEERYTEKDKALFATIGSQVMVVFDRISHQEKLAVANEKLKELNLILEERESKALEVAKDLAHKATLASLTSGIAHEVRNPVGILQGKGLVLGRVLGGEFVSTDPKDPDKGYWEYRVSAAQFIDAAKGDERIAQVIVSFFRQEGYFDADGKPTDKFKPVIRKIEPYDLPDALQPYLGGIERAMMGVLKTVSIVKYINEGLEMFTQVLEIVNTMMKYGKSAGGVKPDTFIKIGGVTQAESEEIFNELLRSKYINLAGTVINPNATLYLPEKYQHLERSIKRQMAQTPGAMKSKVSIREIFDAVHASIHSDIAKEGINLLIDIPSTLPAVLGDSLRLHQAFLNILMNSIQALAKQENKGGMIRMHASETELTLPTGEILPAVCIQIEDNGPGISPDVQTRIFDPFFSTKDPTGGKNSGLGLSLVRDIIDGHSGTIEVESELGTGTTFKITVPIRLTE